MSSPTAVVIGIDPGKHCGICVLRVWEGERLSSHTHPCLGGLSVEPVKQTTAEGFSELTRKVSLAMSQAYVLVEKRAPFVPVIMAVEHFTMTRTALMGAGRLAIEATGAIRALQEEHFPDIILDTTQQPSAAKPVVTDAVLRALQLKVRNDGLDGHAHDAARHAVLMTLRIKQFGVPHIRNRAKAALG